MALESKRNELYNHMQIFLLFKYKNKTNQQQQITTKKKFNINKFIKHFHENAIKLLETTINFLSVKKLTSKYPYI